MWSWFIRSFAVFRRSGLLWVPALLLLAGYAVLNRGFAYIGYYPIFIGEVIGLFYVISLRPSVALGEAWRAYPILVIAFLYFLLFAVYSYSFHEFDTLRDSVFWIYIWFFFVGFAFSRGLFRRGLYHYFERFLAGVAVLCAFYLVLYPVREVFLSSTGFLYSGTSLIGYYSSYHALAVGLFWFLYYYGRREGRPGLMRIAVFGMILTIFVTQSRAAILSLAVTGLWAVALSRRAVGIKFFAQATLFAALALALLSLSEVRLVGQRADVSIESILELALSITGSAEGDVAESAMGSRHDRLAWWASVLDRNFSDIPSFLFGQGIGEIFLPRLTQEGTILRYVHNSFVTIFGYSGVVGFVIYIFANAVVFVRCVQLSRFSRQDFFEWYPLFFISYTIGAFFSTVYEAPFHSFLFWFITGVVAYPLKRLWNRSP